MIRKILIVLVFLLPVFILVPHLDQFIFQPGSQYSDIVITHYPNGIFLQNSIRQRGVIPLWSDTILSGYPFAANPLSGLHYPPGWLALLFPLPYGFNLMVILHLLWGGIGVFLLLRQEGISFQAALFSALVFESLPKIYGHLGAGHLTLIYSVCWTPWLLFVEGRYFSRKIFQYLLPGTMLGIISLADIRWTAYASLIWVAYSLHKLMARSGFQALHLQKMGKALVDWMASRFTNGFFAILIAAPLLLPLAQFVGLSTRSQLTSGDHLVLSLPPLQLIGLVYPNIGGPAEWIIYPGACVFGLVVYAAITPIARKRSLFWLGVIVFTIILSLGSNIPYLDTIFAFPGLNLLRVPPRALFLTGLAFSIVAGYSMQSLCWALEGRGWAGKDPTNLVIFGFNAFIIILACAVWLTVRQDLTRIQFTWGAVFSLILATLIFLVRKKKISMVTLTTLITSVCLVDLIGVNGLSLTYNPPDQVFSQGKAVADYLSGQEDISYSRIYSPSYSLPQQTAARYGFKLADGVDPMQLTAYAQFMQRATGVPSSGYSVTIPPFMSGNPVTDNQDYIPDVKKLGLLNVRYVVAEFPLDGSQLTLVARFGKTRIYLNPYSLPRAWVQPSNNLIGKEITAVDRILSSSSRIQIQAKGPGLLVLSEIAYPGWEVTIDKVHSQIITVSGLLRGVLLPEGDHVILLAFRPKFFYAGMVISSFAWTALAVVAFWRRRQNDRV